MRLLAEWGTSNARLFTTLYLGGVNSSPLWAVINGQKDALVMETQEGIIFRLELAGKCPGSVHLAAIRGKYIEFWMDDSEVLLKDLADTLKK